MLALITLGRLEVVDMSTDPMVVLIAGWKERAAEFAQYGNPVASAEARRCAEELHDALQEILNRKVPYEHTGELTEFAVGSLQNRKDLENVGTRENPAFRLGALPVKRIGVALPLESVREEELEKLQKKSGGSAAESQARARARKAA